MNTEFVHDKHCVIIAITGKQCYYWQAVLLLASIIATTGKQCYITVDW